MRDVIHSFYNTVILNEPETNTSRSEVDLDVT